MGFGALLHINESLPESEFLSWFDKLHLTQCLLKVIDIDQSGVCICKNPIVVLAPRGLKDRVTDGKQKPRLSGLTLCWINEVTAELKTARMSAQDTRQANSMARNAKLFYAPDISYLQSENGAPVRCDLMCSYPGRSQEC